MKKNYIISIFCLLFILLCSATSKMYYKTENKKLVRQLVKSNGNAFYVRSTYITISYVWSYAEKEIVVYKLSKGKIANTKTFSIAEKPTWIIPPSEKDLFELDPCMELDGDMFGFFLKNGENVEHKDLPINVKCFRQGKFKSDFLNEVANDINVYKIKWEE